MSCCNLLFCGKKENANENTKKQLNVYETSYSDNDSCSNVDNKQDNHHDSSLSSSSHRLCDALFIYHRLHTANNLSENDVRILQEAKNVIDAADKKVLSTQFHITKNEQFCHEVEQGNKENTFAFQSDDLLLCPIHVAAFFGSMSDIVKLFLERYPEGKCSTDSDGDLPITYAILGGCSDTVKLMIQVYPEALSGYENSKGDNTYPLHEAAMRDDVNIIQLIYEAYPEGISVRDDCNELPIHQCNNNIAAVKFLHSMYPDGVKAKSYDGHLPIHCSAINGNVEVTRYLYDLYPEGILDKDNCGYLPFHHAVEEGYLETCKLLLEINPEGVYTRTTKGDFFPMHLAAFNGCLEVAMFLHSKDPEGIKIKGYNSSLPIHLSAAAGHLEVTKYFCELYPEGASILNDKVKLPVHLAIEQSKLDVTEFLLSQYPAGASVKDSSGSTAMHYAAKGGHTAIVKLLHEAYPSGSLVRKDSSPLPIGQAVHYGHLETVKTIFDLNLSSTSSTLHQFTEEIFNHDYPGVSKSYLLCRGFSHNLWARSNSVWVTMLNHVQFGRSVLQEMGILKSYPFLLPAAIGKIHLHEIEFMVDEMLQINLKDVVDTQGQNVLTVVMKEASKNQEEHWNKYYKPLVEMINSKLHNIDKNENHLSSKGVDANHNILHCAIVNGLPWFGLEAICKVNIDDLTVPNVESGLYPFMLANESATLVRDANHHIDPKDIFVDVPAESVNDTIFRLNLSPPRFMTWQEASDYASSKDYILPTQEELRQSGVRPSRGIGTDEWHPVRRDDGIVNDWVNIGTWIDGSTNYISHLDYCKIRFAPAWGTDNVGHEFREGDLLYVSSSSTSSPVNGENLIYKMLRMRPDVMDMIQ